MWTYRTSPCPATCQHPGHQHRANMSAHRSLPPPRPRCPRQSHPAARQSAPSVETSPRGNTTAPSGRSSTGDAPKLGQIAPNGINLELFKISFSIFGHLSQIVLKTDLCHLGPIWPIIELKYTEN